MDEHFCVRVPFDLYSAMAAQASVLELSPFLGGGLTLKGILEIEVASIEGEQAQWVKAMKSLDSALSVQDHMPLSSSLYRGITGIGWALQLLPAHQQPDSSQDMLQELDDLLADGIECTSHPQMDLVNGLAGIMVYAMRRGLDVQSSRNLWQAIEIACTKPLSDWLLTRNGRLEPSRKAEFLRNLGMAHGIPGLLVMGAVAIKRGYISESLISRLVDGFDHLWSFALPQDDGAVLFPALVGETKPARLAWCYGALGLAEAFRAASAFDDRCEWRFQRILQGALNQFDRGEHQIQDASLCHGYSGAGFYFKQFSKSDLANVEQKRSCRVLAQIAYTEAISMNTGSADRPRFVWPNSEKDIESLSYLEGTSGVLLALKEIVEVSRKSQPWAESLGLYSS